MVAARPASPATVRTATTRVATSAAACRRDVRTVPPQGGVGRAGPCARRRRVGERVDRVERLVPAGSQCRCGAWLRFGGRWRRLLGLGGPIRAYSVAEPGCVLRRGR